MAKFIGTIKSRHEKLAFYGVPSSGAGGYVLQRMTGFTSLTASKNPKEHSRQYVDEEFERSDIVGYAPQIAYSFDRHEGNAVHDDIVKITDEEKIVGDAVRTILVVDTYTGEGYLREFSVIPDSEGDDINIYTYSGNFKARGEKTKVKVTSSDNWVTVATEIPES